MKRGAYKAKKEKALQYLPHTIIEARDKIEADHAEILSLRLVSKWTWREIADKLQTTPYLATRAFARAVTAVKLLDWKGQIKHEPIEEKTECFSLAP